MINVCVTVLNRYDMLHRLVASLNRSDLRPDALYIMDSGRSHDGVAVATHEAAFTYEVVTPTRPLGVAEAWNWFLQNVEAERVICNDDVAFAPGSLRCIVETEGDLVSPLAGTNAFSCFRISDACVDRVGLFDERISPEYAYFEDLDYVRRMELLDIPIVDVACGVEHVGSQTIAALPPGQMNEHHRRFKLAQANYIAKWGRLPEGMVEQL